MTEQTPLKRLEEAISNWDACHPNDFEFFSQRLFDAAQSYMEWAEARIKELRKENRRLKGVGEPCVDCGGQGKIKQNGVCDFCGGVEDDN